MSYSEKLELPLSIAQVIDLGRVLRELNLIDEHLHQVTLKHPNQKVVVKSSAKLTDLIELNNVDLTDTNQRNWLISKLTELKKSALTINISFAAEADESFIETISEWFRSEIDPNCLLIVGLEPSIGAGSVVRTSNRVFNLSLHSRIKDKQVLLIDAIKKLGINHANTP